MSRRKRVYETDRGGEQLFLALLHLVHFAGIRTAAAAANKNKSHTTGKIKNPSIPYGTPFERPLYLAKRFEWVRPGLTLPYLHTSPVIVDIRLPEGRVQFQALRVGRWCLEWPQGWYNRLVDDKIKRTTQRNMKSLVGPKGGFVVRALPSVIFGSSLCTTRRTAQH